MDDYINQLVNFQTIGTSYLKVSYLKSRKLHVKYFISYSLKQISSSFLLQYNHKFLTWFKRSCKNYLKLVNVLFIYMKLSSNCDNSFNSAIVPDKIVCYKFLL